MTRKEAIEVLDKMKYPQKVNKNGFIISDVNIENEALDMAINALSPAPRDDAISRQAVLDVIDDEWICNADYDFRSLAESIEQLPSVRPQKQTGKWIDTGVDEEWYARAYECSLCGHWMVGTDNYCPNCGARMVEPQESEDKE